MRNDTGRGIVARGASDAGEERSADLTDTLRRQDRHLTDTVA